MSFDLNNEIAVWLNGKTEFVPEIESAELVEHLLKTERRAFNTWLLTNADSIVATQMRNLRTRDRTLSRLRGSARAFAEDTEDGPPTLDLWRVTFRVDDENRQKVLGEMVGADHLFVADQFAITANSAAMEAAFHRAVAKKVGLGKTSDVFDPDTYMALRDSLKRGTKAA